MGCRKLLLQSRYPFRYDDILSVMSGYAMLENTLLVLSWNIPLVS